MRKDFKFGLEENVAQASFSSSSSASVPAASFSSSSSASVPAAEVVVEHCVLNLHEVMIMTSTDAA